MIKFMFGEPERSRLNAVANALLNGGHLTTKARAKLGAEIEDVLNFAEVVLVVEEQKPMQ